MEGVTIVWGLIGIVLGAVITRAIFSIDEFLKVGKVQIGLSILAAKKQGATKEEIDAVLDKVYGNQRRVKENMGS